MGNEKVLVLAASKKARGGISTVVNAYTHTDFWKKWKCYWLGTQIDRNKFYILIYFIQSFVRFLFLLPRYQIIHIHLSEKGSALRKSFYFLPARIVKKKIVVHFHAADTETTVDGAFRKIYKYLFKHADCVIVLSEIWKKKLAASLGPGIPLTVIHNPCPEIILPFDRSLDARSRYILFAGTLNDRKGYQDLINAFAMIAKGNSSWKIVFAGNGEIEKGRTLAKSLNIETQVQFAGWVSGKEKHELFSKAAIFCLPSYAEGFPMSVLDAMAYSIPVLSTPVGGILDIFSDNKDILLCKSGDIKELSEKLQVLISDENLRKTLSENATLLLNDHFRVNILVTQIDAIYKRLIA